MLQLEQTYTGYPDAGVQYLLLPGRSLLLYPSADAVIILDAQTLELVRVLAIWEAFPGLIRSKGKISCVSVDSGMKLVVAAMDSKIAVWSLSDTRANTWRTHSTLNLPGDQRVTCLDNKAGLLAVGCAQNLSVYTLVLENDLPTWSKKWSVHALTPSILNFAPSLAYIASTSTDDFVVRLYSTTSGRQTQSVPHPRAVTKISWRRSQASSRDDLIMYTITADATLRIFMPVLDAPDVLQLHTSLDLFSSLPFFVAEQFEPLGSSVFWVDGSTVGSVIANILKAADPQDDVRSKRIREIRDESWDLFLRILGDGSIVVTAIANIDKKPPTLLQQFTLQQSQPGLFSKPPLYLYILPNPNPSLMTLVTSPPLMSMDLSPLAFFDAQSQGLNLNSKALQRIDAEESEILRFIRTPEGNGVGALRVDGAGEAWKVAQHGSSLTCVGNWNHADFVVPLSFGNLFATYRKVDGTLTLHSTVPHSITIPNLESLFSVPSSSASEQLVGITKDFTVVVIQSVSHNELRIESQHQLPLSEPPKFILPVDPMAWGYSRDQVAHDELLSISAGGVLSFWVYEPSLNSGWVCSGQVRTGRKGFRKVRCSSAKKTALIVDDPGEEELTIWDSKESEFASGLEFRGKYRESILDLDWSSTPDMQSILAVGYAHKVDLLCQQRTTYFSDSPGWTHCRTVDISSFTPYPISDSIWLAHGSFLVAAGPQMYLYSEPQPVVGKEQQETLMEYVSKKSGPLEDYHPQMLLQCLLWEKLEVVKEIIMNLVRAIRPEGHGFGHIERLPVERFLDNDKGQVGGPREPRHKQYTQLFNSSTPFPENDEVAFNRPTVERLVHVLEKHTLPDLSENEQAHLIVLVKATLNIEEQRRALDANGLRYMISMRSFYIINQSLPAKVGLSNGTAPKQSARRERLRYRDMIWAFFSESQDLLLSVSSDACGGKMTWPDAKAMGVAIWLGSVETLKTQMEVIARNEYMAGENRDPTKCSLFYFALGKAKLVHGLWRQAAWHKEQKVMLKFLANDFTEPRWRTAALKNAFALLSKQRFEYAAAFFLLGGSPKDAINICLKQLNDFQLAVALARVVEGSNDGPLLQDVLTRAVLPTAFELGNRYLASWAFWLLHRRDLSVRILVTPLQDIAAAFNIKVAEIGEPHYDDPSLALLFSLLRSKTLQAAKGTSEISGRAEFNFVLQMARVFCRMGCQVLALDLVRGWSFTRPTTLMRPTHSPTIMSPVPSRTSFPLERSLRRQSSIMIDMDILSLPPTRQETPNEKTRIETHPVEVIKEESDLLARKTGMGNLLKSAKQDVQVPEFDMSAFF